MTVPTNVLETPMGHTKQESLLESKGRKHRISLKIIQHVFKTDMGLFDDKQVEDLSHWIHNRGHFNFDDMYDTFCHDPEFVYKCEEYKWNGVKECICPNIAQKVKSFIQWMNMKDAIYILHDHFLISLTREDYMEFRKMDIEPMPDTRSSHTEPPKPMTTLYGHTKPTTMPESQTALNNFIKGTKGMHQPIPSSRMIFTMIHFKDHFWQSLKHKDFMMLLTLIMTLMMVISMTKNDSKKNNSLFILYWLLPFRQKRGESWS